MNIRAAIGAFLGAICGEPDPAPGLLGDDVPEAPPPGSEMLPSDADWRFLHAWRSGGDIVVPSAIAVQFGWDSSLGVRDGTTGACASGRNTRDFPGIMGCALPVLRTNKGTLGSPLARCGLPWFINIEIARGDRVAHAILIDNRPPAPPQGAPLPPSIALTPQTAIALGLSLETVRRNATRIRCRYIIRGGAKHLSPTH